MDPLPLTFPRTLSLYCATALPRSQVSFSVVFLANPVIRVVARIEQPSTRLANDGTTLFVGDWCSSFSYA